MKWIGWGLASLLMKASEIRYEMVWLGCLGTWWLGGVGFGEESVCVRDINTVRKRR